MKKTYVVLFSLALIMVLALGIAASSLVQTSSRVEARDEATWRYMTVLMSSDIQYKDLSGAVVENPYDYDAAMCEFHLFVTGLEDTDPLKLYIEGTVLVQPWNTDYGCTPSDDPATIEEVTYTRILNAAGDAGWQYVSWIYGGLLFERAD